MTPAAKSTEENPSQRGRSPAGKGTPPAARARASASKNAKAKQKTLAEKSVPQKRKTIVRKKSAARGIKKKKSTSTLLPTQPASSAPEELEVRVADHQHLFQVDRSLLRRAARQVLSDFGVKRGQVTIAIVRDQAIRRLNRLYLREDEPTDVLSFPLEKTGDMVEGEIIVSSETALTQARLCGNDPQGELLLYVIHGALHLVGFDDHRPQDRAKMRRQERRYLKQFGFKIRLTPLPSSGKSG